METQGIQTEKAKNDSYFFQCKKEWRKKESNSFGKKIWNKGKRKRKRPNILFPLTKGKRGKKYCVLALDCLPASSFFFGFFILVSLLFFITFLNVIHLIHHHLREKKNVIIQNVFVCANDDDNNLSQVFLLLLFIFTSFVFNIQHSTFNSVVHWKNSFFFWGGGVKFVADLVQPNQTSQPINQTKPNQTIKSQNKCYILVILVTQIDYDDEHWKKEGKKNIHSFWTFFWFSLFGFGFCFVGLLIGWLAGWLNG